MSDRPLLAALNGTVQRVPPVWLMRQAGRYLPEYREVRARAGSFLDLCYAPKLAAEATLQPVRRFALDAAILFADILLVPQALGQRVRFVEGDGPSLDPVRGPEHLERLNGDALHDHLAPIYETVARVRDALPQETALIGFAGAPWTVATYMVEGGTSRAFERVKAWAFSDPEGFQRLIDLLVEATTAYLARQIEAGAHVVQLFDTWAGVLPEPAFRRWCIAPTRRIADALRARFPDVPVIGFPRGAGVMLVDYAGGAGVRAVGLDAGVPLAWARETVQPCCAVQGNLDPVLLVAGGDAMRTAAADIVTALGRGPFVFNLGHGILPQTPPEHVAALVETVRAAR